MLNKTTADVVLEIAEKNLKIFELRQDKKALNRKIEELETKLKLCTLSLYSTEKFIKELNEIIDIVKG